MQVKKRESLEKYGISLHSGPVSDPGLGPSGMEVLQPCSAASPPFGNEPATFTLFPKYNAAEEGFRIDNTPQWGRFLRPAGDPLLFRTSNPRCRHAWPEVRPDHRPEPRGPSRDRALAALDHRPRWADPSRPL